MRNPRVLVAIASLDVGEPAFRAVSLTRDLDFGRLDTSGRGSPRDQGFEYNWAHADATTGDLIATYPEPCGL